jgi:ABC-2 type transport system ATP-binding protein
MLVAKNLSKSFGDKTALKDLSLSIDAGKILALLGNNGAGKSTTLNLLLHFITPDSGQVLIDNQPIDSHNKRLVQMARQQMAYLPEQVILYEQFNAIENLQYLSKLSDINADINAIEQGLKQTGLDAVMWSKPLKSYSKGMRQKVGIAFAVISGAKILLLDEPTSGLDPSATREFITIIRELAQQGTAVLMVTHDLDCASSLANDMLILKHGQVVDQFSNQDMSANELKRRYHQAIDGSTATPSTAQSLLTTQSA